MKSLLERIVWRSKGARILEAEKTGLEKYKDKHGIVSKGRGVGFSEREQKFYGWSHRAIVGFGIGDKIFESPFGDGKTPFVQHGTKPIKNMKDAEEAARAFSEYVS